MLKIAVLMLTLLFSYTCFGMESTENNEKQSSDQIAKLAQQVSKNINLGHGLVYLGSRSKDPEDQKLRIGYAYEKFERANYLGEQVVERISTPERKKE